MHVRRYLPSMQGRGEFDGGKITEQKPIGFPGEGSVINRIGPLFYWAWAHTPEEGHIPLHPHFGFEIMTYVIQGKAEHGDSLGTRSTVGSGGAQLIRAGSGVSHEERLIGPDMESFQIWFEPDLKVSNKREPSYEQWEHEQFPVTETAGGTVKQIVGGDAPLKLSVDAGMWDVQLEAGGTYSHPLRKGRALTALALRGGGRWSGELPGVHDEMFDPRDFMLLSTDHDEEITVQAQDGPLRMLLIEIPERVDYSLLPKRY
ncbi:MULTISPECIES: pirin family protein [unclassified Paenibacillus]|uniref:pirin family protein n=1 Tax=unclassified Paenibacillus TaxID=185978 RepID=UPI0011A4391C|nr:pirin family protein [Paenibacillus sp. Y412MC10]